MKLRCAPHARLTLTFRRKVDGFGADGTGISSQFQPQFVAAKTQWLKGAGSWLDGVTSIYDFSHVITSFLLLLHPFTGHVSPPANKQSQLNDVLTVSLKLKKTIYNTRLTY